MKRFIFLLICIAALRFVRNSILISDDVIYDSLSDQLSHERIIQLLDRGKKVGMAFVLLFAFPPSHKDIIRCSLPFNRGVVLKN